jgi:predicted membrane protein
MKPSKIVKEELYGPSGIKILGMMIGGIVAGLGMLAIIVWFYILLSNTFDAFLSSVLACVFFIIGTIIFLKLLQSIYFLIYPEKRPKSAMDLAKRYEEAIDREARKEEIEEERTEHEKTKKRKEEKNRSRDIGDTSKQESHIVGDPEYKFK